MDLDRKKRVKEYYEATRPLREEIAKWIDEEEEKLQRDLTEEEIQRKSDELHQKYGISRLK